MGSYTLSGEADADIEGIAERSLEGWGVARAEKYILELHRAFQMLAELPDMGREIGHIRPGYFRWQTARHSVFYRKTKVGILIVRIIHERRDVERTL